MKKENGFHLSLKDPVEGVVSKYKDYLSLNAIRGSISKLDNPNFRSEYTSLCPTLKELEKLDPNKASQVD